jgi:hypothetical protein
VLMIKFGKARKTGCSGFLFRIVRFRQFQNMNRTEAKLEDLKIQCVLKKEKRLKGTRDRDRRKSSKKPKSQKLNSSVFYSGGSGFSK